MKRIISVLLALMMLAMLGIPAFATDFVASVEAKTAPELVEQTDDEGNPAAALYVNEKGEPTEGIERYRKGDDAGFYLLSAAERKSAEFDRVKNRLAKTLKELAVAENPGKLDDGMKKKLGEKIDAFYGDGDKPSVDELVVSDVFDASLIQKRELISVPDGKRVRFGIKPGFGEDSFFILLNRKENGEWDVVDDVAWTDDGCLLITSDSLDTFAVLVEKKPNMQLIPGGPDSPITGDEGSRATSINILYGAVAVLFAGATVCFFFRARKTKVG